MKKNKAIVAVVMGSKSDWDTMQECTLVLKDLRVPFHAEIVSAHRTPKKMADFAASAAKRGFEVIIAGAGGAAHLPGMIASQTELPVVGVPVESKVLKGIDSLLSIVQMPFGIPVGTVAIGKSGAKNAALFAASILALRYPEIKKALIQFREDQTSSVLKAKLDQGKHK